jgi:FKBP-type peptidyl-prolyl cis-trans isomerase FkpA
MKKNLMFLALATIGLASCNGGYKKGDNGLLYNIYVDKAGPKLQEGDFVLVNLIIKNDADSVLMSTYDIGRPTPLLLPKPQYKGDLFDGMKLLTEGDSASFKLSADSLFKRAPKPPTFKGKFIIYDVKIVKLIAKGKQTDDVFHATVTNFMMAQETAIKNEEPAKIKKYIADKKLTVSKTDSGLYYVITKPGTGPVVAKNDTAVVNYTGSLLTNGKVFDTNVKDDAVKAKLDNPQRQYTPIHVPIGQRRVIAGWDQGLLLLNKGAKATFIIPSNLAYGQQGNGQIIPPFAPIAFDIEVVDIIHPKLTGVDPAVPTAALPPVKSVPVKK